MRFAFRVALTLTLLYGTAVRAQPQDDLVAKAQDERELILYGTALAAQFDKFAEPFKRRYPFLKVQYSRTTGEALTSKILREYRRASSAPTSFSSTTTRTDWTLSDSYEE